MIERKMIQRQVIAYLQSHPNDEVTADQLRRYLRKEHEKNVTVAQVRECVYNIRRSSVPRVSEVGARVSEIGDYTFMYRPNDEVGTTSPPVRPAVRVKTVKTGERYVLRVIFTEDDGTMIARSDETGTLYVIKRVI